MRQARDPPAARVTGAGHGSDHTVRRQGGLERLGLKPAIEDLLQKNKLVTGPVSSTAAATFTRGLQTFIMGAVKIS